ncbi:hypothetical protein EDB19DRAFT_1845541 [Suillus lakei]|nr:hypothetical protein EDB19DRAFT_1845541 [Suillus lakei]
MLTQTQHARTAESCVIYGIDVTDDGKFKTREQLDELHVEASEEKENDFWSKLKEKAENVRVRALFVDNLTVPVLKMLGTRYNIEPFFFSSSTNWIPSRYQEEARHEEGDHITVILPFIRTTGKKNDKNFPSSSPSDSKKKNTTIDVLAPLYVQDKLGRILLIDLLAVHMVREKISSTIITYHPSLPDRTTARRLHQVMERAGGSELILNGSGFTGVADFTNMADFTSMADLNHSLHSLQAHLLHYQTLLHDFEKSVAFVRDTPNPAMACSNNKKTTNELMKRECENLLSEIDRLERRCSMFISRLKNATDLAFATVNIEDSRQTHRLTKATLRDSAAMKQISYLTMVFLPASFTASVFGMNVVEINPGSLETIARYVEVTFLLTIFTTWIVIAFQPYSSIHENSGGGIWRRAAWPYFLGRTLRAYFRQTRQNSSQEDNTSPSSPKNNTSRHPIWRGVPPRLLWLERRLPCMVDVHATNDPDHCPSLYVCPPTALPADARTNEHAPTSNPVDQVDLHYFKFPGMSSSNTSSTTVDAQTYSIPAPVYRHAAPSGPWPWVDFNTDLSTSEPIFKKGEHEWRGYPQELFGNWSPIPVKRSEMLIQCARTTKPCAIYSIDLTGDGKFKTRERVEVSEEKENEFWSKLKEEVRKNVRVRALFVEKLSEPVLKMLGTKYNIEPFFFSSSANWIPSRYREEVRHGEGDHITVILPFIRTTEKNIKTHSNSFGTKTIQKKKTIDVMAPLHLHGEHVLLIDLLAVHMIREKNSSTIITYHPALRGRTTAERLHQVMERAGGSVYWNKIFEASKDPTFFFLAILWYALYAWDEAFEVLYKRIKDLVCMQSVRVVGNAHHTQEVILNGSDFTAMADLNHDLHSLQAHLLQYQTLLHDFERSVTFVMETPNPAMEDSENEDTTKELMQRECKNLLSEIDRLHKRCSMFISRLKNATDLAFATVNIEDSRQTHRLTKATLRDSAAMKQISYLTMVFLPASFTACMCLEVQREQKCLLIEQSVFGMNVREINPDSLESITRYVWVSFLLTFVTTWIVIALQPHSTIHKPEAGVWRRAAWPGFFLSRKIIEDCKSFRKSLGSKNTSPQANNIPLRGGGRNSSTLLFDDAMFEEDGIGG